MTEQREMQTPLGKVMRTPHGCEIIRFRDRLGVPCTLQQSNLEDLDPPRSSAVWLGVDRQDDMGVFDIADVMRMHLDIKKVKALIAVLEQWVANGSFVDGRPPRAHEPE